MSLPLTSGRIAGLVGLVVSTLAFAAPPENGRTFEAPGATLYVEVLGTAAGVPLVVVNGGPGFDHTIWQFPVVLIPLGTGNRPDSVVLRPIDSVDGMTARAVRIPHDLLAKMVRGLMEVEGVAGVFYDLTNKPPATIEWE